jgi:antitoxin VapB
MALHIEDAEVERLAAKVAELAHESETEAVRRALADRMEKLTVPNGQKPKRGDLKAFLEREVWPKVPPEVLGKPVTKQEVEEILGFGPEGY